MMDAKKTSSPTVVWLSDARGAAAFLGVYFLIEVSIQLARISIDVPIRSAVTFGFLYVGLSHLVYAVGGSRFEP